MPNFVWQGTNADLARAGYYLFLPNPRGSYGQGEAFTRANMRDFGGGDLKDILAGIDAAERAAPIDDNRLGLMGGSYGGFMAMWANTQTHRFKAIVSGAGLSNWISYYGTNGIDQWMIPFFGKSAYDDPDAYWAVSAIRTIKKARTPTFIYVGERDIEVPPTQSVEYWHALQGDERADQPRHLSRAKATAYAGRKTPSTCASAPSPGSTAGSAAAGARHAKAAGVSGGSRSSFVSGVGSEEHGRRDEDLGGDGDQADGRSLCDTHVVFLGSQTRQPFRRRNGDMADGAAILNCKGRDTGCRKCNQISRRDAEAQRGCGG